MGHGREPPLHGGIISENLNECNPGNGILVRISELDGDGGGTLGAE